MKITYDKENNLAYIYLKYIHEGEVAKTADISDDMTIDYDINSEVLGIELLDAEKQLNLINKVIEFEDMASHKKEVFELKFE